MEKQMPRTLDEVIAGLPEGERVQVEARARELIAEEMSLRELRKAIGKTQATVAIRLKVGQDAVSKIETRSDMYVSTLRDFISAMRGKLTLLAQFPDRPPVRLEQLGTASLRSIRPRPTRAEKSASGKSVPPRVRASEN
jgi:DNA-binding transcriptional ArsR family regulator